MLDWLRSFTDEIKTAASQGRLTIPKVRQGRRSMTVATLLRKEKDGTLYKEAFDEHIPGGLAAGKKPSQFNAKSLAQGRRVEREHTTSNEIATEISMDHLTEDPHYYRKLVKMEKESEYKAAVSIAGMQQAYQRLGAIRVKPTKGSFGNVVGNTADGVRDMVANGPATLMPKRVASKLKATIPSFLTEGLDPEELAELTGGVQQQISAAKNVAKQHGGKILMTPGGGYRAFRNAAGIPGMEGSSFAEGTGSMLRGVSPEGKKAINLTTGLHESYERAAKQHQQFASHLEPAVIYKEHNLLRNMSGPGADEARTTFQGLRGGPAGEGGLVNDAMHAAYGDKAKGFAFGAPGSQKITKAMRKDLQRRHTEVWTGVQKKRLHDLGFDGLENKLAEYQEVDPRNPTVKQTIRFAKGDVPSRDDIPGRTATEFRPMMAGTVPAGRNLAPEGFNS